MGKVVISHITALLWLLHKRNYRQDSNAVCKASLSGAVCPDKEFAKYLQSVSFGDGKIDCVVSDSRAIRKTRRVRGHLLSGGLPAGSLIPLEYGNSDVDLFTCSPELVFYQLATMFEESEAIYFGMALCSDFRLEPAARGGVVCRKPSDAPLTSPEKIKSYLDKLPFKKRPERAYRIVKHLVGHARSPKECALGMLFSLPTRLGGFDLGRMQFNVPFRYFNGTDMYGNERYGTRIPDIVLEHVDYRGVRRVVAVDYDPAVTHSGEIKGELDIQRRNDIAGVRNLAHFSITSSDAMNFIYLETLAERIRRALGRPKRPSIHCGVDTLEGRKKLEDARMSRLALWKQFVRVPFEEVIADLPLDPERPMRRKSN